jgi:hypothetical protein
MRRWIREPLAHFLAAGALLFLVFHWFGGGGQGSGRIVITPGQVDAIVAGFTRTWMRPPTDQELKAQLDEYVREEIATREAIAMGLDRGDAVVRRRLRQKFEFAAEDTIDSAPPDEAALQAWLAAHPALFRVEPAIAFRQSSASRMLPSDMARSPRSEVARIFGDAFTDEIFTLEPGRWAGPIRSGYGVHQVLVLELSPGRQLTLAEARPQVEREFGIERRRRRLDEMYATLLGRYRVVIEKRTGDPAAASARAEAPKP